MLWAVDVSDWVAVYLVGVPVALGATIGALLFRALRRSRDQV